MKQCKCGDCEYWAILYPQTCDKTDITGECRRYPPPPVMGSPSRRPRMNEEYPGCGEWKRREEESAS